VARWNRSELRAPRQLWGPDPAYWGPGEAGPRRWFDAAWAWLMEDPDRRRIPGVGDWVDLLAASPGYRVDQGAVHERRG